VVRRLFSDRSGTPADLIVVGLGNPGEQYQQTRHNAGFWVVDELARRHDATLRRGRKDNSRNDVIRIGERRIVIAQPTTFYNEAGRAVAELVKRHGVADYSRVVVVHDEMDLGVGRLKVKFGGGLAGNNGLKSVKSYLGTDEFGRLRIGIGKPPSSTVKGRDFVLKRPARADRPVLEEIVADAADAVEFFASADIDATMNRFNR